MEESVVGMGEFIDQLLGSGQTSLYNQMWGLITDTAPFIVMIFVVAVGYYVLRKVVRKGSRLKAGI